VRLVLPLLAGAVALAGCALLGKSEPTVPRYFTPASQGDAPVAPGRPGLRLRLGRIEGGSHLRERMASRRAAREIFYYEDRRWTERPEVYLRRALARSFFEERGLVEVLSGRSITLDVELIAFEEIERPPGARLQARWVLRDDRVGLAAETITVEQPLATGVGADQAGAVVDALSEVLRAGVARIADRVVARLAEQAPRPGE
jgi:cholesterol transport system auxiliary component